MTPCAEPAVLSHRRTRTSGLSRKVNPMIARALRTIVILAAGVLSSGPFTALAEENVDSTALARALADPLATLRDGVKASEIAGIPISAKFEIEDGKLQLSVYTVNAGEFVEVIADPKTRAAIKTEKITESDDLYEPPKGSEAENPSAQVAAIGKASVKLVAAADMAEKANAGFRVVGIEPELEGGHPVAIVTLLQGTSLKKVVQKLD